MSQNNTGVVKYFETDTTPTQFKLWNCETKMFDLCEIRNDGKVEIVKRSVDKLG